jgi:hypothetical protein
VDINDIYGIMLYALSKNLTSGYLAPSDFDTTFNQAQRSYVGWLLGNFQTYSSGRPIARVELGNNSVVRQRLQPSIYQYNLTVDTTGFSRYPSDYIQTDSMWSLYGYNRIKYIQQNQVASVYNSVIDPYQTNPFYLIEDVGFRFYPQSIGSTRLSYVKDPPKVHWGYTLDVNGIPVYNAATSVQCIFDEVAIWDIISRALLICGVNLSAHDVEQYAASIKAQGQ